MSRTAQYAVIHVKPEPNTDAWPIVERTRGGWQSGVHHYPDSAVLDVRPMIVIDPATASPNAVQAAADALVQRGERIEYAMDYARALDAAGLLIDCAPQCECDGPGPVTDMHRPYCPAAG